MQLIMDANDNRIALCAILYDPDTNKLSIQVVGKEDEVYAMLDKFFPGFARRIRTENP